MPGGREGEGEKMKERCEVKDIKSTEKLLKGKAKKKNGDKKNRRKNLPECVREKEYANTMKKIKNTRLKKKINTYKRGRRR